MVRLFASAILLAAGLKGVVAINEDCAPCTMGPDYACPAVCYGGPITAYAEPSTYSSPPNPCACTSDICPECVQSPGPYPIPSSVNPGGPMSTYVPPPKPTPTDPCEPCLRHTDVECPETCPEPMKEIARRNSCNDCTSRICPMFCSVGPISDPLPSTLKKHTTTSTPSIIVDPPPPSLTSGPTPIPVPICNCCQCDIECGACPDCPCETSPVPSYAPTSYPPYPTSYPALSSGYNVSTTAPSSAPFPTGSPVPKPICNCCQCDAGCEACPDCVAPANGCISYSEPVISEPSTLPWYTTTGLPQPTPLTPKPKPKKSATPLAGHKMVKPRTLEKVVKV